MRFRGWNGCISFNQAAHVNPAEDTNLEKIQKSAEEIISTGTGQLRELPESIGVGMYPENSLQTKEELSLVHEKLRSAKDKALHEIAAVMGAESSSEREIISAGFSPAIRKENGASGSQERIWRAQFE